MCTSFNGTKFSTMWFWPCLWKRKRRRLQQAIILLQMTLDDNFYNFFVMCSKFCHNHRWCKEDCQSKNLNTKFTVLSFLFDPVFFSGAKKYFHLPRVLTMLQWWGPPGPWCLLFFSASAAEWGWSRASPQTQVSHSLSANSQSQASSTHSDWKKIKDREKRWVTKLQL